jgi:CMP-N,N'-diacetyllegionaminic acid synthase
VILGVVPARGGSKGLVGKNLRPLGGLPLVVHTIHAAQKSALLSDFVVSTDDPEIAAIARGAGARVPFLRPAELATDAIAVWPAVRHAVEQWEAATPGSALEAVVLLQPTSPLRNAEDIDNCITRFREHAADICVTVVAPHDNPYFNMVEITADSAPFARPCSPIMRAHARRQDAPTVYALNGAAYVVARSALATLENQFHLTRYAVCEMPRHRSVDIDSLEDLELAEWLLAREGRA